LPNGSLYFLHARVSQENDTGTYFCVARNDAGRAKSGTAVLEVSGNGGEPSASSGTKTSTITATGEDKVSDKEKLLPMKDDELKNLLKQPWILILTALTIMLITISAGLIFLSKQMSLKKKPTTSIVTYGELGNGQESLRLTHDILYQSRDITNLSNPMIATKGGGVVGTTRNAHGYMNRMVEYPSTIVYTADGIYEEVEEDPLNNMSSFGKQHHQQQQPSTPLSSMSPHLEPAHNASPYATTRIVNNINVNDTQRRKLLLEARIANCKKEKNRTQPNSNY